MGIIIYFLSLCHHVVAKGIPATCTLGFRFGLLRVSEPPEPDWNRQPGKLPYHLLEGPCLCLQARLLLLELRRG